MIKRSKRLPIEGRDHTFVIHRIEDAQHSLEQAEKHYKDVKRRQCISDYNVAIKDLDSVYDKLLQVEETTQKLESSLKEIKVEKEGLEALVDDTKNRLVLAKARLLNLNVPTDKLEKPAKRNPVLDKAGAEILSEIGGEEEPLKGAVLAIPDDEQDVAIKNILDSGKTDEAIDLTSDNEKEKRKTPKGVDVHPENIEEQQNVIDVTSQSAVNVPPMPQNVVNVPQFAAKVPQTPQLAVNLPQTTHFATNLPQIGTEQQQNIVGINPPFTTDILKSALDSVGGIPQSQQSSMPQSFLKIVLPESAGGGEIWRPLSSVNPQIPLLQQNIGQSSMMSSMQSHIPIQQSFSQSLSSQQLMQQQQQQPQISGPSSSQMHDSSASQSGIPEGFRKTRYENTLEKINPQPEGQQKAGKRFFCALCLVNGIYTGYTKRFDLVKHLERCGKDPSDKPFKCQGYDNCTKSFARIDSLKQHIASDHTKAVLYTCKKCKKGFTRSSDATNHRKICFQEKEDDDAEPTID